jgi:hypothetical protein
MKLTIRSKSVALLALLLTGVMAFGDTASSPKKKSSSHSTKSKAAHRAKSAHASSRKGKRGKRINWRNRQEKMDSERVRQLQAALIREHYLTGEPTGVWDQRSQNAMMKLQSENGWQTKVIPDSRALIKLGLGPSNDHLLNPDSAITSPLQPGSAMQHSSPVSTPASATSARTVDPVSTPQK